LALLACLRVATWSTFTASRAIVPFSSFINVYFCA
jgi:hypothetical protein